VPHEGTEAHFSQPLKIAVFSDSLLPLANGVSVSIDTLVSELRRKGHEVHLFAPDFPGHRDSPASQTHRFPSIRLRWADGYPVALPPAYPLLQRFRRESYDLVHTHTIGIASYIGLKWARAHEIPLVASYHTLYDRYAHYCTALPRRYVRYKIARHTQQFYNQADAVITPSEAAKRWLKRHKVNTPIKVIATGIPRPEARALTRAEARATLGIEPGSRVLLTVGRLVEEKNLRTLIEATTAVLRQLGPSAQHWFVGDGPYRSELVKAANQAGVGKQLRLVGAVEPSQVAPYYSAADLFVFASVTETQGLVVQEAMSYGLPAVLIEGGGASGAVCHGVTGFLAKNNADSFASTIQQALSSPDELLRIGMNAEAEIHQHDPSQMAHDVEAVYRSVLAEAPRRLRTLASV
jgi:glycosyltransferase involved in cell wall biosynthesis